MTYEYTSYLYTCFLFFYSVEMNDLAFWKIRARGFDNLNWVNHRTYLKKLLSLCSPKNSDVALDVGTGTGKIARALSKLVNRVVGLDFSLDMLSKGKWGGNMKFVVADARKMPFDAESFDLVTIRSVLHHVMPSPLPVLKESFRVLNEGGRIVVSEGVPPSNSVLKQYESIFSIKEKRILFKEGDVENLLLDAGFDRVKSSYFWIKGSSVRNWLEHSGLKKRKQEEIFNIYLNDRELQKAHNCVIKGNDCLVDVKTELVKAFKD